MSKQFEEQNVESWDPDHYETGSTQPPKSYGGLVAVLLVVVILLGGICSTLGIINLKLLRQITDLQQPEETVSIFEDPGSTHPDATIHIQDTYECSGIPCLELKGQTVSDFDRRFYHMPAGVLVLDVTDSGSADLAGIAVGDVITHMAGTAIHSSEELTQAVAQIRPGQTVTLQIYRPKTTEYLELSLALSEE
jgi:hypothetical protein